MCKLNYPAEGGGYQRYPWYPTCEAKWDYTHDSKEFKCQYTIANP